MRVDSPKLYAELRDFIRTRLYREVNEVKTVAKRFRRREVRRVRVGRAECIEAIGDDTRTDRKANFAKVERQQQYAEQLGREISYEYAEIEQTLLYLSGYVQRLTFSDEMKGEIRHRLDEAGSKSFMGRWQNKKSDVFC